MKKKLIKKRKAIKSKKWYKAAVEEKPPYKLDWKKDDITKTRRKNALKSRPKNWRKETRLLSSARALQALANVTQDVETRRKAQKDADYFFKEYDKIKK